jgi:hypothetical protein
MTTNPLLKKLLIKPGYRLLLLNAPEGYAAHLGALPDGVSLSTTADGQYDWVQLFVYSVADLHSRALPALQAVKPGGLMWFSYPKKTGSFKTDITRDHGWQPVIQAGWEGVTQIAIDSIWSALRFRPLSEIKVLTRKAYRQ